MPIQPTDPDADYRMMSNPDEWPHWPFLPLKRLHDGVMEFGVLCCPTTVGTVTYFLPGRNLWDSTLLDATVSEADEVDAARLRELVNDGWRVD